MLQSSSAPASRAESENRVGSPVRAGSRAWAVCVVALVGYWVALAIATHMPLSGPTVPVANFDKLEHLGGYFVLGSLLGACVWLRYGATSRNLLLAWGVTLAYAALEEVTQIPFNRHCDLFDWLADAAGSALGLAAIGLVARLASRHPLKGASG